MSWRDKVAATVFAVALLASLGTVGYITLQSRAERDEREAQAQAQPSSAGGGDAALIRGIVRDFGRAVQRDDPESACVLLDGEAFAAFDCRFGRQDVPKALAIAPGAEVGVAEVVVDGDQALTELRGGGRPQPVRLERREREWRIIRVGLPRPS